MVGVVLKDLLVFDGCIKSIEVVVFSGNNIRITSPTCKLSNCIMCSDSYPHPYLVSFLFIPSLYPLLLIQRFFLFSTLLPFFTVCMPVQSPGVQ